MRRKLKFVGVSFILFGIVFVGLMGLLTSSLWNALMPAIFALPKISFWQALGLLLLGRLLFGGFGRGWGGRHRWPRTRWARGWMNLTPEERERFRQAMRRHVARRFGDDEGAEKGQQFS